MKRSRAKTPTDEVSSRKTLQIAVRVRDWALWCRQIIRGVQDYAHSKPDWRLYVDASAPGQSMMLNGNVKWDGIIAGVLAEVPLYKRLIKDRTKVIAVTASIPYSLKTVPAVRADDGKIAEYIGSHLLSGGFRRFAFYGGIPNRASADHRFKALRKFARSVRCPYEVYIVPPGCSFQKERSLLSKWLRQIPKPIGIATFNIYNARKLIEACQQLSINVPAEVGIVAWDDDPILAETVEPTISATVLPAERIGYEAAKMLDDLLSGKQAIDSPHLVEPTRVLHVRQSSDTASLQDRDIFLAMQYIREHARERIRVPAIASALRISRRKLEMNFLRVTGTSPHEAITRVRLEYAKQLLIETKWDLGRIAERSGIGTEQSLIRLFAQREQIAPTEYREKYRAI
ncbi:MAG TPA: substrate-binding domain-containing protein [Tepidisphaeraceae bacterium]|jgi:LacI family transcriptional regulator|nr:substrate-binding domain-containing protein [Tepidisphaeraceae bacterium]